MAGLGATFGRARDSFEARSSRFSFRIKLGVVYAVITVLWLLAFFYFDFDLSFMLEWLPFLAKGVPLTLGICLGGILLATALALLGALGRLSRNPVARGVANFYVSFIRGTPLIVQIFFIYFALPQIAFKPNTPEFLQPLLVFDVVVAGILALGINYGAYMTEIFRAGIQSVGHGQMEAAQALGMGRGQVMRRIVLPQAVRVIIPPTGNEFIAMLKDSSLVGIVGTQELFFRASNIGRQYFHSLETLVVAALLYWIITGILTYFQAKLERRMATGYVRDQPHGH